MKKNLRKAFASFLILGLSSGCATISVPPNVAACASLTDPFDIMNENPSGFCKYTLSSDERTISGEKYKDLVRTGVVVSFDDWVALTSWARHHCAKTNNSCLRK